MAQFQVLNPLGALAGVQGAVSQGQGIRQQRQQNRLSELMEPYKMQQAQMQQERMRMSNQQLQGTISDEDRGRRGRDAQLYLQMFGPDLPSTLEEADARHKMALQGMGQAGVDIQGMPEGFDPNFFDQAEAFAAESQRLGGKGDSIQSTFLTDQGERIALYRSGKTKSLGKSKLTPEEQVQQIAAEAEARRGAEAGVDLKTKPQIEAAVTAAREQAKRDEQRSAAARNLEDLQGSLDRMRDLTEQGIYTGAMGDKIVQGLASGGIVFDQDKLNRTTRVRQIATNLKFMAKPAGMGAMSDSEWKIIRDAIPDPDSATAGQLLAGLEEFERRLQERAGMTQDEVTDAPAGEIKFLGYE